MLISPKRGSFLHADLQLSFHCHCLLKVTQQQERLTHVNAGLGIRAPPVRSKSLMNH